MMRWRMMRWRSVLAGGGVLLGAYVSFLVVLAPATLLDVGLQRTTDGRLRLAQAHGTLWSGGGQLEIRNRAGQGVAGKELSWSLQPHALWRGRLDFAVAIGHAAARFPVRASLHGVEFSNVDFSLPARALGAVVPRLAPLDPRGELVFHIAKFTRAGATVLADGRVTWTDASSAVTTVAPLGAYELRFSNRAGSMHAVLHTRSGPLQLAGSGSWRGGDLPVFSVTARVVTAYRAQLTPLLRLVAVERGNGDFALQLNPPFGRDAVQSSPKNPGGSSAGEPDSPRDHPTPVDGGD